MHTLIYRKIYALLQSGKGQNNFWDPWKDNDKRLEGNQLLQISRHSKNKEKEESEDSKSYQLLHLTQSRGCSKWNLQKATWEQYLAYYYYIHNSQATWPPPPSAYNGRRWYLVQRPLVYLAKSQDFLPKRNKCWSILHLLFVMYIQTPKIKRLIKADFSYKL